MYSVVLLAAMTTGGQTPDFHHVCWGTCWGACNGNCGLDNNCYGTCYGNGYGYNHCGNFNGYGWSYYGCTGSCWGTYGNSSPYFVTQPGAPVKTETIPPPKNPPDTVPPPKPGDKSPETLAPSRARLIVEAPADAKLFIDDHAMKTPSDRRAFQTPDLEPGQTYYYEVRVELERDGKPLSETKRVLVRAGQEVHADFNGMTATAAAQAK
jgi:uncharacterized protein (TIGR03000 family)